MIPEPTAVIQESDNHIIVKYLIKDDLVFFPGHFPEHPVLPGVVILDWVIYSAKKYFQLDSSFTGMENIKFKQLIQPQTEVTFEMFYDEDKQRVRYKAFSENGEHSSGKILSLTRQAS